jgi:SMI1 / KNR4 family (SUKH-1)
MFETQLNRIKEKLARIQTDGWENYQNDFMPSIHKFQMNPTLSEAEVAAFEEKFSVNLPQDYKEFLVNIGNGGAGPYYRLLSLEQCCTHKTFGSFNEPEKMLKDFFNPQEHFSKACEVYPNANLGYGLDKTRKYPFEWQIGTIALSDQGCANYTLLVVNGDKNYGKVCYSAMGSPYFMPDRNFISWYERWLDEVLSGREIGWFGGYGYME